MEALDRLGRGGRRHRGAGGAVAPDTVAAIAGLAKLAVVERPDVGRGVFFVPVNGVVPVD